MPIANDTQQLIAQVFNTSRSNSEVYDVIAKMREAAADPSPLTRLIEDPAIVELARLKKEHRLKSSSKVPSIRKLAIEEEEYQLGRLKVLLQCSADHLEHAVRRAEEAEVLGRYAESQEKAVLAKLEAMKQAKSHAQAELQTSITDSHRFQLELQSTERDLDRLKNDLRRMERLKDEYEKSTVKAEEQVRQYKNKLLDYRIRESNLEHGHRIELLNTLDEGREEGWIEGEKDGYKEGRAQGYLEGKNAGRAEGYEEGRAKGYEEGRGAGRKEGLLEGYKQGRDEERKKALEAFDKFLDEEMNGQDEKVGFPVLVASGKLTLVGSETPGYVGGRSRYIAPQVLYQCHRHHDHLRLAASWNVLGDV
ncbi:hypothetical protein C0995_007454 [Termitomyces sp. Mi166|nr:hypothetical protein C0995_007454 [Termitomyces sp. Mi166\